MNLTQINEILKDFYTLRRMKAIEVEVVNAGEDGAEGLSYEVYKLPNSDIYVKLRITTDSYGDEKQVAGIEFVEPIQKTVTQFKSI